MKVAVLVFSQRGEALNPVAAMLSEEAVYALRYEGRRYDCGNQAGFLQATVDLALARADVGEAFRQYLQQKTA